VKAEQHDPGSQWLDVQSNERSERTAGIRRTLIVVLVLNMAVASAKLGYGLVSGSIAMTADGAQSLLDGLSNVVGLVGIAIAARPPDEEHHYGHERYETLASLFIAMMMAVSVLEIVRSAFRSLVAGDAPTVSTTSFVVLASTICVNRARAGNTAATSSRQTLDTR
jgi:cation diffusion facilitator family transporter